MSDKGGLGPQAGSSRGMTMGMAGGMQPDCGSQYVVFAVVGMPVIGIYCQQASAHAGRHQATLDGGATLAWEDIIEAGTAVSAQAAYPGMPGPNEAPVVRGPMAGTR